MTRFHVFLVMLFGAPTPEAARWVAADFAGAFQIEARGGEAANLWFRLQADTMLQK